jgi:hypothetical protein
MLKDENRRLNNELKRLQAANEIFTQLEKASQVLQHLKRLANRCSCPRKSQSRVCKKSSYAVRLQDWKQKWRSRRSSKTVSSLWKKKFFFPWSTERICRSEVAQKALRDQQSSNESLIKQMPTIEAENSALRAQNIEANKLYRESMVENERLSRELENARSVSGDLAVCTKRVSNFDVHLQLKVRSILHFSFQQIKSESINVFLITSSYFKSTFHMF